MRKSLKKFGKKQKRQNDRSRDNNNNSWEAGDLQQGIKKSTDAQDAYGTDGGYTSGEEIAGVNATIGTTNASAMNNRSMMDQ